MKDLGDLHSFCKYVIDKFCNPRDVTEDDLAEEFSRIYLKGLPVTLAALRTVAAGCGIKLKCTDHMPANMRGFHEVYGKDKNIYYRNGDTASGIQNTILHEIREMMETFFGEVCPDYRPLKTSARHIAANQFASAVLLPKEQFRESVYDTGLDVVALSRIFSKSCSQVLLRMGEVLKGELFSYLALYEPVNGDSERWKVNYWTMTHNGHDAEANVHGLSSFLPRKGRAAEAGSLVDMTVHKKKAHHARRITMLECQTDPGLTAITRPVLKQDSELASISLLVLLASDKRLLETQIERVKPVSINELHRKL